MQHDESAAVPFEVWSHIFTLAYESYKTSSLPLPCDEVDLDLRKSYMAQQKWIHSLSSVCRGWRTVIAGTPAIWSSLSMDVTPTNITACIRAIALHRRRSGARLSIGCCFCTFSRSKEGDHMLPVASNAFKEMEARLFACQTREKLVALVLRHAPEVWLMRMSSCGGFPCLSTFLAEKTICIPTPPNSGNQVNHSPTRVDSPFPHLTHLSLKKVPSHVFVSQAAVSPTLTDVEYHGGSDYVSSLAQSWSLLQDSSAASPAPIILNQVEKFSWCVSSSEILLQYVRLNPPTHLNFTFEETSSSGFSAAALESVCMILQSSQDSQPTIPPYVTLSDLFSLADPKRDLKKLLHAMRNIESLEVRRWSGSLLLELVRLMSKRDSIGMVYLPRLRILRFDLFRVPSPPLTRAIMDKLLQVVRTRPSQTHGNQYGLEVVVVCQVGDPALNCAFHAGWKEVKSLSRLARTEWIQ